MILETFKFGHTDFKENTRITSYLEKIDIFGNHSFLDVSSNLSGGAVLTIHTQNQLEKNGPRHITLKYLSIFYINNFFKLPYMVTPQPEPAQT